MTPDNSQSDEKRRVGEATSLARNEPDVEPDDGSKSGAWDANDKEMTNIPDTARSIGGWMITLLWIIALGAGAFAAQNWLDQRTQRRDGVFVVDESGSHSLRLASNRYGQYRVKGSANGQAVYFLIDTGASGISIPESVAAALGLRRGRAFTVNTANGTTTVYATTLDSLSIGPLSRRGVEAHINPSMDGEMALLGMSFLRHYELTLRAGELTISTP